MKKKSPSPNSEIVLSPDEFIPKGFNWFPGHMAKAIREIKEKLKSVDIVFEIRDARAPLASANYTLAETLRQKSHLIIINKVNLADPAMIKEWEKWFASKETPYIFVNCFEKGEIKKIMNLAKNIVQKKRRQSNPEGPLKTKMRLMIIGLPNTGKSTIINQLANRNAAKVADKPGQTQTQQLIVIDKDLDLIDTPGVMPPFVRSEKEGLWLCALNAIPDDVAGIEKPVHFLVEYFLKNKTKEFLARYKFDELENLDTLSVGEAIEKIAKLRGCIKQKGQLDLERAYTLILLDFRKGELGKPCFEKPPLK